MKFFHRMTSRAIAATIAICLAAPSQVSGQDTAAPLGLGDPPPMMTVYGRNSKTLEGDHDFRQVIFFSVPASHKERLYLRIFDPDTGGALDTIFGSSWPIEGDTKTRFAVFGGDGAFVANVSVTGSPLATELSAGTILAEETFDLDETADGQWRTIALLDPAKGDLVDNARVFRLLVEGVTGNDGNLFSVSMSSEVGRNETIEGTRIFSFLPTVRVPNENDVVELSFPIPAGAKILRVNNFDASFGRAVFTSRFRSVELATSGQNEWSANEFALRDDEQGTVAALVFSGGLEMPNDLTFHVSTSAGALLPVNLPPKLLKPNKRPELVHQVTPLSCTGFAFDATGSSDPDGQPLSYLWQFGDGTSVSGLKVEHDYPAPGKYAARLEVTDTSGHIGNGTAKNFNVTVKQEPVAIPRAKAVVARDVPVLFDGTASTAGGWPIGQYVWTFEDGTTRVGAKVQHRFATSGPQTVKLRIVDISDHPCDTAEATIALHVNARPVAEAGDDGRAAIAQAVTFDAGRSTDADGTLTAFRWQLGDGTVKQGRKIGHAYAQPGAYKVTLTVTDDAGVENSTDTDATEIFVNAPPVPVAGEDAVLAIGQTLVFDGRASTDTDGHIISRHWDMGDGTRLSGLMVEHAYEEPGTYAVTLTVTDDAGVSNSTTQDSLQVVVNAPPVAEAGDEHRIAVGEAVSLSAASSKDSDGKISSYRWNMGDGTVLEGRDIEHRYSQSGDYAVVLEVIDSAGITNSVDLDHARVLVNAPPSADAGADVASVIGEVVQFDATSSADPDGNIVSYEWDFGDGGKATGPKPNHAYHAVGAYRVVLTIKDDSRTSTDTAMASVTVRVTDAPNTSPIADAGKDVKVIVGQEVHFDGSVSHDPDGSVIAHEWDFGDGFTSSGPVPVYAYREAGTYTVTLLVRDNSGLGNDTHTDTMTVHVDEPPNTAPTPAAGKDQTAAIGEPVTFDAAASTDPDGNILSYKWDFADGELAEGVSTVHAYDKSGTYEVVLTLQDDARANTGLSRDSLLVKVNEPPVADAGPDQLVTASLVQFDGTGSTDSDGKVATYVWDFGDGGRGTGPKPTHVYREPGTYEVSLIVGDDSGTIRNTAGDKMQVVVNATPIADAGPDLIGEPGEKLVFQGDRSVDPDGSIVNWVWDFKDGATATGRIVEHAFEKPGTYYVGLRVHDDTAHGNAIDYAETVVVINAAPTADAGPDLRAAPGDDVTLSAANSFDPDGDLIDYRWDFSDTEEPLAGQSVTRKFHNPGVYKAQLTVVDDSDVNNGIADDEVTIAINHAPVAAAGRNVVTPELRVVFDASESADADGDGLIYSWNFGDGQTATGARVAHTYAGGGVYPVVLTVDDGTGLNNATDQDKMTVKINRPPVALAGESRRVCTNDVVAFDGSRSMDPEEGVLRYAWDFGDGSVSDIVNPTRIFDKPGTYPVTLRVEDDSGLKNSTHSDRIMVKVDQAPAAKAGPDVLACVHTEVKFDGSKSIDVDGVVNRFTWDFGDGSSGGGDRPSHIYRLPGKYRVLLNIEGDRGNQCDNTSSDQTWVRVIEAPVASIVAPRATPVSVAAKFDGSGSTFAGGKISRWEWDFGDGETAEGPVVEHVFATAGTYRVALTIHSDAEISDCRSITAYQVVEVNQAPLAMPGPDLEVSVNQDALFDGSASADPDGGIVAYVWDFGDGSNGTGMQVHHQYQKAGRYQVRLSVTDDTDLANNTSSASIWVTVKDPPGPAIQGPLAACVGENVNWRVSSDGTLDTAKFAWLLGDGATADTPSISHNYERPGQYHITLFVDDGSSIAQSRRHSSRVLHVNQPPTAVAGPDRVTCPCPAAPITFDANGSSDLDGKITRYHWDFGDGETALGVKVEHLFEEPGSYEVRLTVTDDSGSNCAVATDTLQVVVNAQPVADAGGDVVTPNLRVVFDGAASADANGDALTYRWAFGDGHIATGSRVAHTYANGGVYPVILKVDDGTGMKNATSQDSMTVKINRPPVALAGESKRVCTNDVVVFDGSRSTDPEKGVLRYAWDFGDGSVSDIVNPTKTFEKPGTFPVTLRVEDDSGLENSTHSDRIMIKVDQAPAAKAGPDVLACVNTEVKFDGSKSIDVDGVVNRFTWDFGDGNFGGGDRPSHIFRLPGKYKVLLNIEGDRGNQCDNTSSDEAWVRVIEAPVASIASARATPVNVATRFDGSGSTFTGGKISRWEWDFGDGETAQGPVVEHVFATAGTYRVALTIHSDAEVFDCRSITAYQVVEVNQAPVAMPGPELEVSVNQDALFDGSASADPDGGIVAYVWDFGDGTNGAGMQVHHQYQKAGRYQVNLSVTDDTDLANNTSSASIWVTVKDPPGPKIEGPLAACVGEAVDWRAAEEDVLDNTRFTWILGDGAQANQASLAHSYKKPGRYNVTLFVDDGSRISQSRRHSTRVLHVNQPPSAEAGPDKLVCPAIPVAFDASGSGDIDGQIKAYHWDFGDGETASGARPEHVFAKPGTYQVSLTVTDDSGSSCAATTDTMQVVVNAPPVANAGPDHEIFAGGANDVLVFDGSKSNDADKQALSFFWQLGARASLSGERVKHMFTSPGEIDVTLTVSDPTGLACGTASDTMRVIVRGRN